VGFAHTHRDGALPMRTNIEIDDMLMAEAQRVSGHATKKQTVEQVLRLMIRLRRQHEVDAAFGKYRWRGNLARSRKGRAIGYAFRQENPGG
jgi:Arc/MetJ family transcription regulator